MMIWNKWSLDFFLVFHKQSVFLDANWVGNELFNLEKPIFEVHCQQVENLLLECDFFVDDFFELTLRNEFRRLRPPDVFDLVDLVREIVVHEFLKQLDDGFCLDALNVRVAECQQTENAFLLHLAVEEALESVDFENWLLDKVVVVPVRQQLTLVGRILVQKLDELGDHVLFVVEL